MLELFEPAQLGYAQATKLLAPRIESGLPDTELTSDLRHLGPGVCPLRGKRDLFLGEL
jgi:hypothetical protein